MPSPVSGTWTLAGGNNITLSQSGNAVSIIGQPQPTTEAFFWNLSPNSAPMAIAQNTSYMQPISIPYPVSVSFIRLPGSMSHGASTSIQTTANTSVSMSILTTMNIQMFTQGAGANSLSLQEYASTVGNWTYRLSIHVGANTNAISWTQQVTYPMSSNAGANFTTSTNISSTSVSVNTNSVTQFTGPKVIDIPWATSLSEGIYWLGIGSSTASATQVAAMAVFTTQSAPISLYNRTMSNVANLGEMGGASNSSIQFPMGMGSFSNGGGGKSASISFGNISVSSSQPQFAIAFHLTA